MSTDRSNSVSLFYNMDDIDAGTDTARGRKHFLERCLPDRFPEEHDRLTGSGRDVGITTLRFGPSASLYVTFAPSALGQR
jgi:hypothetical protein